MRRDERGAVHPPMAIFVRNFGNENPSGSPRAAERALAELVRGRGVR